MARPFDAAGLQFTGEAVAIVDDVATYSNGEVGAFAVSGGTLVYRKAAPEANRSLVWVDRNGRISDPIGAPIQPGAGPGVRLSPDHALLNVADYANKWIWSFQVQPDGSLAPIRLETAPVISIATPMTAM